MILYKVPINSIIIAHNQTLKFYHIDGMYSLCEDSDGRIVHLHCGEDVEFVGLIK